MFELEQEELKKCPQCGEVDSVGEEEAVFWCQDCLDAEETFNPNMWSGDFWPHLPIPFEDLGMQELK